MYFFIFVFCMKPAAHAGKPNSKPLTNSQRKAVMKKHGIQPFTKKEIKKLEMYEKNLQATDAANAVKLADPTKLKGPDTYLNYPGRVFNRAKDMIYKPKNPFMEAAFANYGKNKPLEGSKTIDNSAFAAKDKKVESAEPKKLFTTRRIIGISIIVVGIVTAISFFLNNDKEIAGEVIPETTIDAPDTTVRNSKGILVGSGTSGGTDTTDSTGTTSATSSTSESSGAETSPGSTSYSELSTFTDKEWINN